MPRPTFLVFEHEEEQMLAVNGLESKSVHNKEATLFKSGLEKIIIGGVFTALLIFITVIGQNLFQLDSGIFEGKNVTQVFKFVSFWVIPALLVAIFLYLLGLVRVLTKLFQAFWSSLEGED